MDTLAEKMLLYQRLNGGWPQYHGDATDYRLPLDAETKLKLLRDKVRLDATIDDRSTTLEINYLLKAYLETHQTRYLNAAEQGIRYLLMAQNTAGGWPQWFPDSTSYRIHITYNDNAMIDVMQIIRGLAKDEEIYQPVDAQLKAEAKLALGRGIDCILKTQVRQHERLTVWCAQHNSQTLLPSQARTFEPPSLSGSESVGIVRFLMEIEDPSPEVMMAIEGAVAWFEEVRIDGYDVEFKRDTTQPRGYDRVILCDETSTIWARFYELETFQPIFTGRNGVIRYRLDEVENERRVGYAFYGKWPSALLTKDYPVWLKKWGRG
jgi:PelA/Pel-15E family pectate lyase